jgi:DNA-binding CsgD family transcriptional regulator
MGRLMFFLELAAVAYGLAFVSVWSKVPAQLALLPLGAALLVPYVCALAVWPFRQLLLAFRDGWESNPFRRPAPSSIELWKFLERTAPLSGIVAFLLFLALALMRGLRGNQAAVAGLCAVEAAAVFLVFHAVRGTVESLVRRDHEVPPFDLSPAKLRGYSITHRESEVAQLLVSGLRYGEIGQRLFISVKTVKTHVHRLYEKTGTRNRMELANALRA